MKRTFLLLAIAAVPMFADEAEDKAKAERLLVAHRIHCAFNPQDKACDDENERKRREVAAQWERMEAERKASRATAAPMPQSGGALNRIFDGIERNRQRRREQPRQVVCYSETIPGPNGGTVQTRCY